MTRSYISLKEYLESGEPPISWHIEPKDIHIVPTINNLKLKDDHVCHVYENEKWDGVYNLETEQGFLYYATGGGLLFNDSHQRIDNKGNPLSLQ